MIESTNEIMQHLANEYALTRNPCKPGCGDLTCECGDRKRSTRLVDYARYEVSEARRVMLT